MSATALAVIVMTAGAVCELGGLGLIVLDLSAAARRARALAPERLEQALPIHPQQGRPPLTDPPAGATVEERLEHQQRLLRQVGDSLYGRVDALGRRITDVANTVADRELDVHQREREIRRLLSEVLTADLGRRRLGVALFAFGVALALVGNLLGLRA